MRSLRLALRLSRALPMVFLAAITVAASAPPKSAKPPAASPVAAATDVPATAGDLTTPAEACDYRCTPRYKETIAYIDHLVKASPLLKLTYYGETTEGYPMPLVIAAKEKRFDPKAAAASGMPVVLVFSGIHAGEIDGKDASLALLRDIVTGKSAPLLDRLILLVVPIYNVDGHERFAPNNRLAQNGPVEGMGFRTNGRGLDLNRDFVKLESPEARALVGHLFDTWRPHLVVDCHVTDGMDFQYAMTYFGGEGPNTPTPLRRYLAGTMEAIQKGLTAAGHKAASFADLDVPSDPNKGIKVWSPSPRYSTAYFAERNRISILSEAHAHKPFDQRVAATDTLIRSILDRVAADPKGLIDAVAQSEAETVRRAAPGSGALFTLKAEASEMSQPRPYLGWGFDVVTSGVTGRPRVVWDRSRPQTWTIPYRFELRPTLQVKVPRGYLVSRAYEPAAETARLHGLRVERTTVDREIDVEVFRVREMKWEDKSYQGHHAATAQGSYGVERRTIPAGTYWIPLDQPDASIAMWMLEPQSDDGLLHWNLFDNVLEGKEIVEDHVVESMAVKMLEDPKVRAGYEAALASDPKMREDPQRRLMWFYERSPYFDREVGVYPVFRVTGELGAPTAPWTPERAR